MSNNDVFVIDATRSPIGKYGGTLSNIRPDDLAASILKSLLKRNSNIDFSLVEEVILGAANQAGEDNRNVARMALLLAEMPVTVPGYTVNRLCASGLQSIMNAFMGIKAGVGELYLAGGVESMTRAPFVMAKTNTAWSRKTEIYDTTIGWRFTNPALSALHHPYTMGETAENIASQWKISREEQDIFAYHSNLKFSKAQEAGKFIQEITPIEIKSKKDTSLFSVDEQPRLSSPEVLAELKPAFKKDGTVTAGNSSGVNDGAACLLLASYETVKRYNLSPIARIISIGTAGVEPSIMGIGPVAATQKAIKMAGISINDLSLVELNEAFASQSLACIKELNLNPDIVNVNGGAIALGHPLGCSGSRISTTLLYEMQKRSDARYGLATMCIGVGQGSAIIYEKI